MDTLELQGDLPQLTQDTVAAHYALVAPILHNLFGPIPVAAVGRDENGDPVYCGPVLNAPPDISTVPVSTLHGVKPYLALTPAGLQWACSSLGAIEFGSWTPVPDDPNRARFARIVLRRRGASTSPMLAEAVRIVRAAFGENAYASFVLQEGPWAASLWLPLADGPAYPPLRASLHDRLNPIAAGRKDLFSMANALSEHGDRISLSMRSNGVASYSSLPYALLSERGYVVVPVADESELESDPVDWTTFGSWLERNHDLLSKFVERTPPVHLALAFASATSVDKLTIPVQEIAASERANIIDVSLTVLADGNPRTSIQIFEEGLRRHMFPRTTSDKQVYVALVQYIERRVAAGRRPLIVQDIDRRFRINHPADDWPEPKVGPAPFRRPDRADALIKELQLASKESREPERFENAVIGAFAALGFLAVHIGGQGAPDGYLDAPLGALGYRVMVECKTATGRVVSLPDVGEAAQYRETFHADFCTLIGSKFSGDVLLAKELVNHHVTAWTVDDLTALVNAGSDPYEMKALFVEPGAVAERIGDLLWEREHGLAKRIAVIAEILVDGVLEIQRSAAGPTVPQPQITVDAATLLVDQRLRDLGSHRFCARDEVEAAFRHLTDPLVHQAAWTSAEQTAIVIR